MMKMLYGMGIENYNAALEIQGGFCFVILSFIFHISFVTR